jgi:hypothetical protein
VLLARPEPAQRRHTYQCITSGKKTSTAQCFSRDTRDYAGGDSRTLTFDLEIPRRAQEAQDTRQRRGNPQSLIPPAADYSFHGTEDRLMLHPNTLVRAGTTALPARIASIAIRKYCFVTRVGFRASSMAPEYRIVPL